jgi:hypothetical protein
MESLKDRQEKINEKLKIREDNLRNDIKIMLTDFYNETGVIIKRINLDVVTYEIIFKYKGVSDLSNYINISFDKLIK